MSKHRGSCHCGAVSFEAKGEFTQAISCNCSICQKKGSLLAFVPETAFKLVSGEAALTDYQFGKKNIHHTFCKTCGVTPFSSGQAPDGTKVKAPEPWKKLPGIAIGTAPGLPFHGADGGYVAVVGDELR